MTAPQITVSAESFDRLTKLVDAAMRVASIASDGNRGGAFILPSEVIEQLRAELDQCGFDWRNRRRDRGR